MSKNQHNVSMADFNLGNFLNKFVDASRAGLRGSSTEMTQKSKVAQETFNQNLNAMQQKISVKPVILTPITRQPVVYQPLSMNHFDSLDRALYVKESMNLPKDLKEFLEIVQKANAGEQAPRLLAKNIDTNQIALFLQNQGKEAVNKLIGDMANASKQGISDLSQIKDTMKLINACVSAAGEKSSSAIKNLILLYLPWIPLPQDKDFELEVETYENEKGESESSITILISTKNYGNVKATLILGVGNSMTVLINCSEEFPKEELLKKLKAEGSAHAITSSIIFDQKPAKQFENQSRQAKINMSNTTEINPFLLLMASYVIRYTIEIDNQKDIA